MTRIIIIAFIVFCSFDATSQSIKQNLEWIEPIEFSLGESIVGKALSFQQANYDFTNNSMPFVYKEVIVPNKRVVSNVILKNLVYESLSVSEIELIDLSMLENDLNYIIEKAVIKKKRISYLKFYPFKIDFDGTVKKLISYEIEFNSEASYSARVKSSNFSTTSELNSGEWFKIAVLSSGVFKLNYNFIRNLGVDINNVDPRNISIYGYGGGAQPENNSKYRPDDLVENRIKVIGENDGKFDKNDYVLFFGQGQVTWEYDTTRSLFRHRINKYSDTSFYFLKVNNVAGKRIQKEVNPIVSNPVLVDSYDAYQFHESESTNLLKSGQEWYGEAFDTQLSHNFVFEFSNIVPNSQAKFFTSLIARSNVSSTFDIRTGSNVFNVSCAPTVLTRYEVGFAKGGGGNFQFTPTNNIISLNFIYNRPSSTSKGWLNYIDLNVRHKLSFNNGQFRFRDINSVSNGDFNEFRIVSNNNMKVWDISDHFNVTEKTLSVTGNIKSFISDASSLKEFIGFNSYDSLNVIPKGLVTNQNLHGLNRTDMVIVSHPLFMSEAKRLELMHEEEGLIVEVVTPEQVYNEFSSGAQDPIAIRSFMRMFYERAQTEDELPKYLLIVGDASYDFKDRFSGNSNFVIGFQSKNSLEPVNSYVSDDYFALLDSTEGEWILPSISPDKLDLGVGRFPVRTLEEATGIVNKIESYYNKSNFGDWQNKIVMVGDDGDGVTHMHQSNLLSQLIESKSPEVELKKVFFDSYKQEATSGGDRYPQVNEVIKREVQTGALIINYTGHGGETGWGHERVLDIATINGWTNNNNLPVFVTATCEFSRFDDPLRTSAGELVLLNPNGGGVALLTTTRLVYSSPNYALNQAFYSNLFNRDPNGEYQRLGDLLRVVKNQNSNSSNTRNFSLLGDPALKILIPFYDINTTEINGTAVSNSDTLKALAKVKVEGEVLDNLGNLLTGFNGVIYPTVFDKVKNKTTLSNDGGPAYNYEERTSKIFKGKATVRNGLFEFEFIVPKDISYDYGEGKISYYTENGIRDGNGFTDDFIIGGSSNSIVQDEVGPEIDLFLNDNSFVYGGITDENPMLVAELNDDQGINTVGNGIGHDLVAYIDGNTSNSIILNEYYEAAVDDYQKGTIRFPFEGLAEGKHVITLKAWDNANNSSEKSIEFNVVSSKEVEINNLVNYPNPFTTRTEFIFQHNQPGQIMDAKIEVFTVSGKLVKSIEKVISAEGFLSRDIQWDGKDDYGDRIGKGVYVYKLKIRSRNGSIAEKYEKLVIL